jgi:SSS family solute:Na+ symporter
MVSALFVPVLFALLRRRGSYPAALLSMLLGLAGFLLFRLYPIEFPKEVASVLLSLVGYGAGEWISSLMKGQLQEGGSL